MERLSSRRAGICNVVPNRQELAGLADLCLDLGFERCALTGMRAWSAPGSKIDDRFRRGVDVSWTSDGRAVGDEARTRNSNLGM